MVTVWWRSTRRSTAGGVPSSSVAATSGADTSRLQRSCGMTINAKYSNSSTVSSSA
jgi:hypothetical protein